MLEIRNLTGGYTKNHDILQDINLDIAKGDVVGIIGLNGSGKSSLAKALMNILPYRQGTILLNGKDVSKKSTKELSELGISMFMQGGRVFDELSVWENLKIAAKNEKEIIEIQKNFASLHVFKNKMDKIRADRLSGGERSQLALAMSVLKKPSLLVLDEPSAGLSPLAVDEIYRLLNLLRQKYNMTIILIEQNIRRCLEFCSKIKILQNGNIAYSTENKDLKEIENIMFNNKMIVQ